MLASLQTYFSKLMGNSSSVFLNALRQGDVTRAKDLYRTKISLREGLEPNQSLGTEHGENTYLHYAALYGMDQMYRDLINLRGKPDMKNSQRRNCLHLICLNEKGSGKTKCEMLQLTLKEGLKGMDIQHLLCEKDENGDTALHLAAGAGLELCVDLLVSYRADMVATNKEGLTPADLAKAKNHEHIATSLEAKMVFFQDEDPGEPVEPDPEQLKEIADAPVAMLDKDLRSMKDALLIETAEMLGVGLQSAEVLLRNHGWSKEELLQAWLQNPEQVCEEVGVDIQPDGEQLGSVDQSDPPANGGMQGPVGKQAGTVPTDSEGESKVKECGICCSYDKHEVQIPCGHYFCSDCWKQYLEEKIGGGESQAISCPEYGCYKLVPLEVVEGMVSREMALKFLSFDIKAFVDSNPNIRWCPHPDCSQAVSRPPPLDDHSHHLSPSHSAAATTKVTGQTVHCGSEHYFCWDCLGAAHEPCSCDQWSRWLLHCEEMKKKVGDSTSAEVDEAASSKWLADNSKPCPKCSSPIEKTEGCNHMCCKHCRHDFCWVCLDDWKCHNASTGGYFNCNRYDAQRKAGDFLINRKQEVIKDTKELEEIGKFLHFFERYKEHIKSYRLEEPFLDKAQEKMIALAHSIEQMESSSSVETGGSSGARHTSVSSRCPDLSFIQDAVKELLKCRRVLAATYCYGYYLTGIVSKKQFEHMQGALEQVTEMLAEAVARPHLRKPRLEIIRLTREARDKRTALVKNVRSGLPLSSHPFLPSFGGQGLPWNSEHADVRLKRFLRDLDTYKPSERRPLHHWDTRGESRDTRAHRGDSDDGFLHALELSRREYEADTQMNADMELAKALSLNQSGGHTNTSPDLPSRHSRSTHAADPSWPVLQLESQHPLSLHLPSHHTSMTPPLTPPPHFSPPFSPPPPPATPPELLAFDSGNGDPVGEGPSLWLDGSGMEEEWGPVYGEEEDLHRAIQDSLQTANDPQSTSHVASPINSDPWSDSPSYVNSTSWSSTNRNSRSPWLSSRAASGLESDPQSPSHVMSLREYDNHSTESWRESGEKRNSSGHSRRKATYRLESLDEGLHRHSNQDSHPSAHHRKHKTDRNGSISRHTKHKPSTAKTNRLELHGNSESGRANASQDHSRLVLGRSEQASSGSMLEFISSPPVEDSSSGKGQIDDLPQPIRQMFKNSGRLGTNV